MKFIEMSGKTLTRVMDQGDISESELKSAGLTDDSLVRVNQQGDIEIRRRDGWDVIGGLLGEFEQRVKHETGLNWA